MPPRDSELTTRPVVRRIGTRSSQPSPLGRYSARRETGLAVRVEDTTALEQPRRAGMVGVGTRPEDPTVSATMRLVRDPVVVGGPALGRHT